jgi:hypothetical protein
MGRRRQRPRWTPRARHAWPTYPRRSRLKKWMLVFVVSGREAGTLVKRIEFSRQFCDSCVETRKPMPSTPSTRTIFNRSHRCDGSSTIPRINDLRRESLTLLASIFAALPATPKIQDISAALFLRAWPNLAPNLWIELGRGPPCTSLCTKVDSHQRTRRPRLDLYGSQHVPALMDNNFSLRTANISWVFFGIFGGEAFPPLLPELLLFFFLPVSSDSASEPPSEAEPNTCARPSVAWRPKAASTVLAAAAS